jgi:glutamate synthase domain-containing protein 3
VKYTDSSVAKKILENWDEEVQRFVRVMPRDYARVLKQQQQEQSEVTHAS